MCGINQLFNIDLYNYIRIYTSMLSQTNIENVFCSEMEVFSQNHPVPFSKMLTFFRKESFPMKAFYAGNIPYPDSFIGKCLIFMTI